ncbi:phospho-sugar mutase [Rhodococcus sp. X156]|uniref:phospho-sugar mutase n=1 Tax=Rhodococcus sp. X156 TaxID=2499145 RepID=UPI002407AF53|nr:phospho-sugar mutase [Rhodococcus sp. X156]
MNPTPQQVQDWLDGDPDESTRVELAALAAADAPELAQRFAGPLRFGTAGLRGPVRAGPNGMNVAVVVRTTAGLARWLGEHGHGGGVVVVGRDARHGSAAFAEATAQVLRAAGFAVRQLPRPLPTPVLAFAVRDWGAVAGVQVTASHNPAADNGYKLYLAGGAQLVPPTDAEIETATAAVGPANQVPRQPDPQPDAGPAEALLQAYLDRVAALPRGRERRLRVALTPLHGVGGQAGVEALRRAGFTDVHVVAAQAEPDPDFPTVAFPNPEEPGACDLLLALAAEVDADLAVALDPDADRCAVGVPTPDGWRMLRGDELGVLLGQHVLATLGAAPGAPDTADAADPLVASTVVSSRLLAAVAAEHGARHAETLTGFKWLVRAGEGLVYAYEEAIGYCVDPDAVRDKDGISAAVLACDLAATLRAQGRGLPDVLDELALRHGLHAGDQVSVRVQHVEQSSAMMQRLRAALPTALDGSTVAAEDLRPRTDAVVLRGADVRVVVRPSGTEPKLKCYLEVVAPVADRASLPAARAQAAARLERLRTEVLALLGAPEPPVPGQPDAA